MASARLKTAEIKDKLAAGIDPAAKGGASSETGKLFKDAAREWFQFQEARWVPSYASRIWSRLDDDVFPRIGGKDVASITPMEVLALLREIEDRNALEMAKRVRQSVSAVFRYAIASGWAVYDPAASLADAMQARPRQQHRATLAESEMPAFFRSLEAYTGGRSTALALKMIAHTFVRTAELRFAEWDEIVGDTWRIPAEKMKMRKEHIVPLSPQVQEMLVELKELSRGAKWLLPG